MIISEDDFLAHYGTLHKSGRYPYGSGSNPNQRHREFLDTVEGLKKQGLSEVDIAKGLNITTTELRAKKSIAKNAEKAALIAQIDQLRNERGMSNVAIGKQLGMNESSVRSLQAEGAKDKADSIQATAKMLKSQVDEKGFIDVGAGVENQLGVSKDKLSTSIAVLKEEGYVMIPVQTDQLGSGSNKTTIKVLAPPGTTYKDIVTQKDKIRSIDDWSEDGGKTWTTMLPPLSIDSKRVAVKYGDEGGSDADGLIYVRPGKEDISLGGNRYAQVRIAVDGTHYLKGMAIYKDDLPKGVDLMFNTNKTSTGNKLDAMKPIKEDKETGKMDETNPFGAAVRQIKALNPDGTERVTSAMNIVNEEGDWDKWSKNLSSQMLSKQRPEVAKGQLNVTFENKKADLDEIMSLTNPTVRRKLLETYADEADSAAVHLKAAAMPRQRTQVILPVNAVKDNEIYAPNFRDGERVALVRYPHGGKFEIPELTVNNRNPEAKSLLGQAADAVGINANVAKRLSGADFDGDTVLVIPNNNRAVQSQPPLARLKDFDAQREYPMYEGMKVMTAKQKGFEMGDVSNLITDMTIRGANDRELADAVRHSMVVIDAEKHKLNWTQSAKDHNIPYLKAKYQRGANSGASTLISQATSRLDVPERKRQYRVDPETGKKVWIETGATYETRKTMKRTGEVRVTVNPKVTRSTKLAETDDAHTLSSGTPIERVYADHSNRLKALGNQARKEAVATKTVPYSPQAYKAYKADVDKLNADLNVALKNRPRERQAQLLASALVKARKDANPDMTDDEYKKVKGMALTEARARVGAKKEQIVISPQQWAAIQAGAITNTKLKQILDNADIDEVKKLATPKKQPSMTTAKTQRAQAMLAAGYTQADIADALGVSLSTLKRGVSG